MKFTAAIRALLLVGMIFSGASVQAKLAERPLTAESYDTALTDAHRVAARQAGLQVLRVEGRSMLPFFGEGSVLVVKAIGANNLRPGMVVVYKNRLGETVAHRLVSPTARGWVAQGYNNAKADTTLVTAENLLGVVYATLHSNGTAPVAAGALAMAERTAVALAAPAR